MKLAELNLASNEEATHGEVEAVGPMGQGVDLPVGPTDPSFVQQAVLGLLVWSTLVLACFGLSELGSCITFGPSEPESVL